MRLVLERARDRARSWYVLGVVVAIALVEGAGKRWMWCASARPSSCRPVGRRAVVAAG